MIPVGPFQGRLARDPEFTHSEQAAMPIWKATLAVDEPYWNGRERRQDVRTLWVRLEATGTQAENLWEAAYGQGDELAVTGRLAQFVKTTEDGKKDAKTHVTPLMVNCTRRKSQRPQQAPQSAPQGGSTNDPWATAPSSTEPPF